ncbi:hypothetical protein Tco_0674404 [Tanacetum coccineum]
MKKWKGRFFFIDRRAIPDAMCWRHHDSDISDPAPKDGFDEVMLSLDPSTQCIRGIPTGLLFSLGLAVHLGIPSSIPLFKEPGWQMLLPMSEYLSFLILFRGDDYRGWEGLTRTRIIPSTLLLLISSDREPQFSWQARRLSTKGGPKCLAGTERGSKRRKEKTTDHIPCPTPLQTIEGVTSDASRGENVVSPTQTQGDNLLEIPPHDSANTTTHPCEEHHDEHSGVLGTGDGNFDDDVDEEVNLEGPGRHVNDTTERVVLGAESIPPTETRPDKGKSLVQEETPMPDPLLRGVGADGTGSSLPPPLFVPTWGIHQRSRKEMHLLDNNIVLDRAWFTLARGAMAQAHALSQFESLYDTHHAMKEDLETTRSHLVRTREDFTIVQNFYNTLSERHRKLREELMESTVYGLLLCSKPKGEWFNGYQCRTGPSD